MGQLSDREQILEACREVMRLSEAVYVTTLDDDGSPCTRAMFNLRRQEQFPSLAGVFAAADDDSLLVLLSTNTSSEKVRQLERDDRASLYYCIPGTFHGVMLGGRLVAVENPGLKAEIWQEGWEIYFPDGVGDEDYTLLRLKPRRARGWLSDSSFDVRLEVAP